MPGCMPRPPRGAVRTGSGAASCRRPARAGGGRRRGRRGSPSSTGGCGRSAGKEVVCLWRVAGHEVPVKAVVAEVEGYKKRFTLVTSAVVLSGLEMVELFAARF